MIKKNDKCKIKIENLVYGGAGISKIDDFVIFTDDAAPGDEVEVNLYDVRKNFAKASITEIIKPSKDRIKPECAMANTCGGCQWGHIDYNAQLKIKEDIVKDTLKKLGSIEAKVLPIIHSDKTTEYRAKVQYPVSQTKVSKRFLAGYYKKSSHELINIKFCPAQPDIINKITEHFRIEAQSAGLTGYNERSRQGLVRHLVFRYSDTHGNLTLTIVVNRNQVEDNFLEFAKNLYSDFDELVGVLVNYNTKHNNAIMGEKTDLIAGDSYIEEKIDDKVFKISAGSFFQVNLPVAKKMFSYVKEVISKNVDKPTLLDAYAGVGSFALLLSDVCSKITAVESFPQAVDDAMDNIKLNNISNINYIKGDAGKELVAMAEEEKKFDVVLLDPPRKGCEPETIEAVSKIAEKMVIYVSCNPSTLARDLKLLEERGFKVESLQPVDLFCNTYHIETVAVVRKTCLC